ncbi:MAG: hypothetical protein ACREL9_01250 [Gemmatimonadales bacterium]
MRWLCFLLAGSAAAQTVPAKPLRFDLTAIPETRDSFVYRIGGREAGYVVYQYEIVSRETGQEIVFTEEVRLGTAFRERSRVVMDRLTGEPVASFQRLEFGNPASDTAAVEHDLDVKRSAIEGRRRVERRSGDVRIIPVSGKLPRGAVWSRYGFIAAAVTNALPGDSLTINAFDELGDSLRTLTLVAEPPVTLELPAGRFDVLPLRVSGGRVYVTRAAPRRIVKLEVLGQPLVSELVASGPVIRSPAR